MTRSLAHRVVQHASLFVDRVAAPHLGVSILIYHRVGGGTKSLVDLEVDEFRRQLKMLAQQRNVITLDEAIRGLSREDHSVDGSVVLTFDDGTADFVDVAVPLLVEFHLPATLYVATQFVDEQIPFPWGAPPVRRSGTARFDVDRIDHHRVALASPSAARPGAGGSGDRRSRSIDRAHRVA